MRREPQPLARRVLVLAVLIAVPAFRLPRDHAPAWRHVVLALISAEHDAQELVVAVLDGPLAHVVRHIERVHSVELRGPSGRLAVGWVKQNAREPVRGCYRGRNYAPPIPARDPRSTQHVRERIKITHQVLSTTGGENASSIAHARAVTA